MIERIFELGTLAACALALIACDASNGGSAQSGSAAAAATAASKESAAFDRDLVTAVSPGKPGAPVELKFKVLDRPQVGEPVEVQVALIPVSQLDRLQASFQGTSGLTIRSGNTSEIFSRPPRGTPITHQVSVIADRDGIFYISATILADGATGSLARSFSIPIIVGQGVAALPFKDAPVTDATGERIKSAPAVETTGPATE